MISTLGKQGGRRAQMGNTSFIFIGRLLSIGETVVIIVDGNTMNYPLFARRFNRR